MKPEKKIGWLLITGAIGVFIPYTLLTMTFEYPDILRTIYSNVYNLTTTEVYVYRLYTRKDFTNSVKLNLASELRKGRHSIKIEKLFELK